MFFKQYKLPAIKLAIIHQGALVNQEGFDLLKEIKEQYNIPIILMCVNPPDIPMDNYDEYFLIGVWSTRTLIDMIEKLLNPT